MAYKRPIEELDLDSFLQHKGSLGGGAFLGNWKEQGSIVVWLHPGATIVPLWSHSWHRVIKTRDGDTKLVSMRFNSLEPEAILKRRNRRDDKTGEREYPPQVCPFSLFLEWLYQAVRGGQIGWTDDIFVFDEVDDQLTIHAGGALGMFGRDDLTAEEKSQMRRARIRADEAWKEKLDARMQYVFRVVQDHDPGAGCVIALEAQALGDKMKKVISDRMDDVKHPVPAAENPGNPFTHPYAFKWVFDDKENFNKKYDCRAMTSIELSPEVQEVFDRPAPGIDELCGPSNIRELRQSFEAHWVHVVVPPWDELFGPAERELAGTDAVEDPTDFPFGANADDRPTAAEVTQAAQPAAAEEYACDVCEGGMAATDYTCPTCGSTYDKDGQLVERAVWPKPQTPAKRSRSGAK